MLIALGDVEMLDEGFAKGPSELGPVRVVAELHNWEVRIEEDVDVVRLERLRSRLARAALFAFHGLRMCIHQGEDGEEKEGNMLDRRLHCLHVVLDSTMARRRLFLKPKCIKTKILLEQEARLILWCLLSRRAKQWIDGPAHYYVTVANTH